MSTHRLRFTRNAALVGAGLVLGAAVGISASANATTTAPVSAVSSSASSSADTSSSTASTTDATDNDSGRGGQRPGETLLTGSNLEKATAAAKAAVAGATVDRAETDADGAEYEVHMTKADGSRVTVKLDASFVVIETQDGMGSTR